MEKLDKLSTQGISKILVNVANDVSEVDPELLSKGLIEKSNIMLRVAKHGIQTVAVMLLSAKMRGLSGSNLKKLPHVEIAEG